MAYSRYSSRNIFINNNEEYRKVFFNPRGIKRVTQYGVARLSYPSDQDLESFETINHVWQSSDTLYNLAGSYYGDAKLWWVIAWYNAKPTETHYQAGDVVFIPLPLSKVMQYF